MSYRSTAIFASVSVVYLIDSIISCLMSDSTLVHSVAEYGIYTGHCNSVLGRNTLLCCSYFGWKFSNFVHSNIDTSNATLSRSLRRLVSDSDWHAVHF